MTRRVAGAGLLLAVLPAALFGLGAAPPPPSAAAKHAFMEQPALYVTVAITMTGKHEFGAGKDALTDVAHRVSQSVSFELPLDMPAPGTPPPSSMPLSQADMMEEDRFITWMAMPPMDEATEALTDGKVDLARSGMFLPGRFSIDDVSQFRSRDMPTEGWSTQTTTRRGRGTVYAPRSGMLGCDLKKMTCDLSGVSMGFHGQSDLVAVVTTSDVPGFVPKNETRDPGGLLLHVPQEAAKRLMGFPIQLPLPSTFSFTGLPVAGDQSGDDKVTVTVTIAAIPAANAGTTKPKP